MNLSYNFKQEILDVIKQLTKYYDLGFVLNNIESLICLNFPYKNAHQSDESYFKNKEISLKLLEKAEKSYEGFVAELNLRKEVFNCVRQSKPDFCQDIKTKLSPDDYEQYLKLLKNCSKDISNFISSFKDRSNDYQELLLTKKDSASDIIDTEYNSRLTYMQDSFVLSELDSVDNLQFDEQTMNNIQTIRNSLNTRIDAYRLVNNLYSKENKINIKIEEAER